MPEEPKVIHNIFNLFLYSLLLGSMVAIAFSFYTYYFKKDYDFVVEVSCDQSKEGCIVRDCSDPELCPSNGLSVFSRYTIKAYDFAKCENEDCTRACKTNMINCVPTQCVEDEEAGEYCSSKDSAKESGLPEFTEQGYAAE